MFKIEFLTTQIEYLGDDPSTPSARGLIMIGDFQEEFASPLHAWSIDDYRTQWLQAVRALLLGENKAALITAFYGPEPWHLQWWPMYVFGDTVIFHNQLLWMDQLDSPLSSESLYASVPSYQRFSPDTGTAISEWSISLTEIAKFVNDQNPICD